MSIQAQEELTWHTDMSKATDISIKENKPMFLFFTGSDWCGWCIRLQKEVFKTPEFVKWAKDNVVLVELDFPRKNNQTDAVKMQNAQLQQQLQVRGYPTVWFVKAMKMDGNKVNLNAIGSTGYVAGGPFEWLKVANSILSIKKDIPSEPITKSDVWKGNGSGFFINEKGYIATNYHVIEDASYIQVEYFQKGEKKIYKAEVVVSDKQNDLSIIKIIDNSFEELPRIPYFFDLNKRDVGTNVFTLGYPIEDVMGSEIKFTDGKISSKTGIKGDVTVYQISVPIQPGNSGGPLFDDKGNLIGITSSGLNRKYFNTENVNYAIKLSYLKNLVDVMPQQIVLPSDIEIRNKKLTDKIKILSDYIPIIRIK